MQQQRILYADHLFLQLVQRRRRRSEPYMDGTVYRRPASIRALLQTPFEFRAPVSSPGGRKPICVTRSGPTHRISKRHQHFGRYNPQLPTAHEKLSWRESALLRGNANFLFGEQWFRHHGNQHTNLCCFGVRVDAGCSTPFGIMEINTVGDDALTELMLACSTPFGIMEINTITACFRLFRHCCAQRLSASQKSTQR